jgi:nitrogen regulatory protein PII 2
MKEVMAIIRMNKMNQTKQTLVDAGISAFHACGVQGRGKGKVDWALIEGAKEGMDEALRQLGPGPRLIPKRMISIIVPDEKVPTVVSALIKSNQTGRAGDGKIFVVPVHESVRVRTGERGDLALDEVV